MTGAVPHCSVSVFASLPCPLVGRYQRVEHRGVDELDLREIDDHRVTRSHERPQLVDKLPIRGQVVLAVERYKRQVRAEPADLDVPHGSSLAVRGGKCLRRGRSTRTEQSNTRRRSQPVTLTHDGA